MTQATDWLVPRTVLRQPDKFGGVADGPFQRGRPIWREGRLAGLQASAIPGDRAGIVLPRLVEPHCHLDKCHTIERLGDVGGDLSSAIAAQARDKHNWTEDDLRSRAQRGLVELAGAGVGLIRSHVDWGEPAAPPLAWSVLTELDAPGVQWAALTGVDQMADPAFATTVAKTVRTSGGVLGSFVLYHDPETIRSGLRATFREAERHGLMLDFHVDEGLGSYNGLEAIADMALETGFEGPVLCGHAVSLMDRTASDVSRIADKLARAGITVCTLPTTNLYLQGRTDATPDRRGITRLHELAAAGVRIVVGSDNVADAFCPFGQHDPRASLHLACLAAQLDPPLDRWLALITTNAARALGHPPFVVEGAQASDLLFANSNSLAGVIAGHVPLTGVTE